MIPVRDIAMSQKRSKKSCKNALQRDESFNYSQFLSDLHGHWTSFVVYMIDEASWKSENKERVAYFAGTSATDKLWPYIAARSPTNQNNQFQPFHISLYLVFIYFLRNNRDSANSKSLSFLTSLMQFREKCIKPCNSSAVACRPLLKKTLFMLYMQDNFDIQWQHTNFVTP